MATLRIEGVTVKTTTLDIQEDEVLLENKNGVMYGGGGPVGGTVGRAFAREGIEEATVLGRAATLDDVGRVAAFAASDHARTMTATALNIACGSAID